MKHNGLTWPGKLPYRTPVSERFTFERMPLLSSSEKQGTTEEWLEFDLTMF